MVNGIWWIRKEQLVKKLKWMKVEVYLSYRELLFKPILSFQSKQFLCHKISSLLGSWLAYLSYLIRIFPHWKYGFGYGRVHCCLTYLYWSFALFVFVLFHHRYELLVVGETRNHFNVERRHRLFTILLCRKCLIKVLHRNTAILDDILHLWFK